MTFETKVILESILTHIATAKNLEQAYAIIARMAKVEGMDVPSYAQIQKKLGIDNGSKKEN